MLALLFDHGIKNGEYVLAAVSAAIGVWSMLNVIKGIELELSFQRLKKQLEKTFNGEEQESYEKTDEK